MYFHVSLKGHQRSHDSTAQAEIKRLVRVLSLYTVLIEKRGFFWFGPQVGVDRSASMPETICQQTVENLLHVLWVGADRGFSRGNFDLTILISCQQTKILHNIVKQSRQIEPHPIRS